MSRVRVSLRMKVAIFLTVGVLAVAAILNGFMWFEAQSLFTDVAFSNLRRENDQIAHRLDMMLSRASTDVLLARQYPAIDGYFLASDEEARADALAGIHQLMAFLQERYTIDEICLIDKDGVEVARSTFGVLAPAEDLSSEEAAAAFFDPTMRLNPSEVYRSPMPYLSADSGRWVIGVTTPVDLPDGTRAGLFHFEIPLAALAATIGSASQVAGPQPAPSMGASAAGAAASPMSGSHDEDQETISEMGGYSFLIASDGTLLVHPQIDAARKAAGISTADPAQAPFPSVPDLGSESFTAAYIAGMLNGDAVGTSYTVDDEAYHVVSKPVFNGNWHLGTALPRSQTSSQGLALVRSVLLLGVPMLVVGLAVALWYTGRLAKALNRLTEMMRGIAAGDVDQRLETHADGEIGLLAEASQEMVDYLRNMSEAADRIAGGDLSVSVTPASEKDTLGNAFQRMSISLRRQVGQLRTSSQTVSDAGASIETAAEEASTAIQSITEGVTHVAQLTEENVSEGETVFGQVKQFSDAVDQIAQGGQAQARGIEHASMVVSQVSSAIADVAQSAQVAADDARRVSESASGGRIIVGETIEGMQRVRSAVESATRSISELGSKSNEIGAIVAVIDDIAAQTNLLALNAAIEAARAGDQGRGFAVVADEVRKLAERVTQATKEIGALIESVQRGVDSSITAIEDGTKQVAEGTHLADQAGEALTQIISSVQSVAEQIEQISAAAEQVTAASDEMVQVFGEVSRAVEDNGAATEEMAATSAQITAAVQTIVEGASQNSVALREMSESIRSANGQVEAVVQAAKSLTEEARNLEQEAAAFDTGEPDEDATPGRRAEEDAVEAPTPSERVDGQGRRGWDRRPAVPVPAYAANGRAKGR